MAVSLGGAGSLGDIADGLMDVEADGPTDGKNDGSSGGTGPSGGAGCLSGAGSRVVFTSNGNIQEVLHTVSYMPISS